MVFVDFAGDLGWQRLHKEIPKRYGRPEESSWNRHGSKFAAFYLGLYDVFLGELGWQRLHKESPKSNASPEESFRNRHRSMLRSKRNVQCSATQTALVSSNFVALALNRNRKQHWYLPIWLRAKSNITVRNRFPSSIQNWRFSGSKSWTTIPTPNCPNRIRIYRFCCAR